MVEGYWAMVGLTAVSPHYCSMQLSRQVFDRNKPQSVYFDGCVCAKPSSMLLISDALGV